MTDRQKALDVVGCQLALTPHYPSTSEGSFGWEMRTMFLNHQQPTVMRAGTAQREEIAITRLARKHIIETPGQVSLDREQRIRHKDTSPHFQQTPRNNSFESFLRTNYRSNEIPSVGSSQSLAGIHRLTFRGIHATPFDSTTCIGSCKQRRR